MVGRDAKRNQYKRARSNISVRKGRSRKILLKLFFNAFFRISVIIAMLFVAREGWIKINKSETFSIKSVKYSGMQRVAVEELEFILDGITGKSIFQVELENYASELIQHRWIKKAVIYKILPDKLDVRIEERVPGAVAQLTTGVHLIDTEGVIIKKLDNSISFSLPLLVGMNNGPVADGKKLENVMKVINGLEEEHKDFLARLSVIDLSGDDKFSMRLKGFDGSIYIDSAQGDRNIINYLAIESLLKRRYESIDYVDLRWNGQIYIKQGISNG